MIIDFFILYRILNKIRVYFGHVTYIYFHFLSFYQSAHIINSLLTCTIFFAFGYFNRNIVIASKNDDVTQKNDDMNLDIADVFDFMSTFWRKRSKLKNV